MVRSADPPPEAKTPWLWGLHANPLTAAQCWLNLLIGAVDRVFQIMSLLSLPPDAREYPSNDHFKPQTYCVWPCIIETISLELILVSWILMVLSLDPLARRLPCHESELTLALCPNMSWTLAFLYKSHISVTPWLLPIEICEPGWFQAILVIELGLISQNLTTLLLLPFHIYKEESKATDKMFWDDHSSRFK